MMMEDTSKYEIDFEESYGNGTIVELYIVKIIKPSQIITTFIDEFTGRLSLIDITWCLPESEIIFKSMQIGDKIQCVVTEICFKTKQVKLSQKYLKKQLNETVKWSRIERGDEYNGKVIEILNNNYLVEVEPNVFGLINKVYYSELPNYLKVKVNSKVEKNNLLTLIPAELAIENINEEAIEIDYSYNFIDEELISYSAFKKSLLGISASDKDHEKILKGFQHDNNIFSKEILTNHTLYIQFEYNSFNYENIFKRNAIPYFFENESFSKLNEKKLLEKLSKFNYWFRVNIRNENFDESVENIEFAMYNEDVNFHGDVQMSKDKRDYKLIIKNFSFGHINSFASDAKKRNSKKGSYLLTSPVKVLSPYDTIPLGSNSKDFLDHVILKTSCFEIVNRLKKDSGELLRQEGKTLTIIDKFLEYQMNLINNQKTNNLFIDYFERIASQIGGVSIKIPKKEDDGFDFETDSIVNVRLKKESLKIGQEEELVKLTEGVITLEDNYYKIVFINSINLDLIKGGFYLDKKISKKQFQIQRDIIQDFLLRKIKIDHIESLLVKPEKIAIPTLSKVIFNNPDLTRTELEQPDNNQIKAVKKAIGNKNVFLIQGPPGTGKTTVIAEIIEQLVSKGEKILVSGQNHVAVDNVLEKISRIHHLNLLRVGNPERVDQDLVKYNIDKLVEDYKVDFIFFIKNQLELTKYYLVLRKTKKDKTEINEAYNNAVNEYAIKYEKLKDIYKERHFRLRDGLMELSEIEIGNTLDVLELWSKSINKEYEILLKPLIYNSVDVVFATCIGIKTDNVFKESSLKFDTVIIDEAGKANIAETLVAIELGRKVILVGDQMQLPPYMDSSLIDEKEPGSFPKSTFGNSFSQDEIIHSLKTSFFEFLINRIKINKFPRENLEMLNYQHRMHPNIGLFVSNSFYDGLVQMGSRTHLNKLNLPSPFNKEIIFIDTSNSKYPYEQNDGFSAKNDTEAEIISEIVLPRLFESNISPVNIAVIAPYKSQVHNIQNYVQKSTLCNVKNIDISTLDSFQGKEYDIIIFSFTRSTNHQKAKKIDGKKKYTKVGFLDDARRLNVAFSRAKKKLILIGNAETLTDPKSHFDGLFNYTQLFVKLVSLSKDDKIGNFVSVTNFYEKKNLFFEFCKNYKVGDEVIGQFVRLGKKDSIIFGAFFKIMDINCLLPLSFMSPDFKERLESLNNDTIQTLYIHSIDNQKEQVTLHLTRTNKLKITVDNFIHNKVNTHKEKHKGKSKLWVENINKVKIGKIVNGKIVTNLGYGYLVLLDCLIIGLLPNRLIKNNKVYAIDDSIQIEIEQINFEKQQILLSSYNG